MNPKAEEGVVNTASFFIFTAFFRSCILCPVFDFMKCEKCGGETKRYDSVKRVVKGAYGQKQVIFVERFRCTACGSVRRRLPDILYPYKQYEKTIIDGFVSGELTNEMTEFEDYPTDITISRWTQFLQLLI